MTALERAARCATREITRLRKVRIAEYPGSWKASDGLGWENLDDVVEATVRAVLMAVREPGDVVIWKGHASNGHLDRHEQPLFDTCATTYAAIIDAILNEKDATND